MVGGQFITPERTEMNSFDHQPINRSIMKLIAGLICLVLLTTDLHAQISNGTDEEMKSLGKHITALLEAFAKGDAATVARLHHPGIVKYFGGNNVVNGRDDLRKGAEGWFKNATVEFIENIVESTVFNGETAIQTSLFSIKNTPKNGGKPEISRGRAMVIYIRDKDSPTGWLSLREMVQAAPEKK
jgi:ketosteroid isomerase-like protein